MKVAIIKVSAPGPYKVYKQQRGGPPQSIFSLGATTPRHVDFEIVDETGNMSVPMKTDADLVAIFMSTPDAVHGYQIADAFRKRGKTVVLGGLHASFLPEEALEHCDTVMIGEAEGVWEQLLDDYEAGTLKKRYQRNSLVDMATLKAYPITDEMAATYDHVWSVLVSRGCPFQCSFCTVNQFFDGIRYRPVGAVVDEIKKSGLDWFELHADNLTHDRDYAMELFTALKPLGVNWVGETTIKMAGDDELLKLASESGMRYVLVGLESPSQTALAGVGKGFVKPEQAKEYVEKFHEYKIVVDASMIFGFDGHDKNVFSDSLEFMDYCKVDVCDGIIVIPFPGTHFYKKLEEEGRILTKDWSLYDGSHAVFQPANMTPEELETGQAWFHEKYYSMGRVAKRKARQVKLMGMQGAMMLPW